MFYVCSAVQTAGEMAILGSKWTEGKYYIGGVLAGAAWTESSGTFTAIDALSGERVWQKEFPEACYSGTSTTKGNLVFLGRSNGELEAYDARNGERLWNFQTGAGANNTASFFEHEGKQYVVFLVAGQQPPGDAARGRAVALRAQRLARPGGGAGHRLRHRARRRGRRRGGRARAGERRRRQGRLHRELLRLPRRERHRRQRWSRPLAADRRHHSDRAGHERRRRNAGVRRPARQAADQRRRGLRDEAGGNRESLTFQAGAPEAFVDAR